MIHKIFGYKGFVVRIIPQKILTRNASPRMQRRYAARVAITHSAGMSRGKRIAHFYPAGVCRTPDSAMKLGARYAIHVIDDDLTSTLAVELAS